VACNPSLGLIKKVTGDAVFAPTLLAPSRTGRNRRLVVVVHDAAPWTHPETLTPQVVAWQRSALTRAAAVADALVVPTHAVAAEITRYVSGRARVHVIGEGVTEALARDPDEDTAAAVAGKLELPPGYLLAVGTLERRKGLDVLVRALARPEAPVLPLVVVGGGAPGGREVDVAALAHVAGLPQHRLRLLGVVPDEDLAVVLHRATVLVAPSLAEGFGLPVLEAMAAGAAVLTTQRLAIPEVGGDAVAYCGVDARDIATGLVELLDAPARRAELSSAAQRRAKEFSWAASAALHREAYSRAAAVRRLSH